MHNNKFLIDLSSVKLSNEQRKAIDSGIQKVVSKVLAESALTQETVLIPIKPSSAKVLYGPGGGDTGGYHDGGGGDGRP